jgi:hypothetical protein
VFDEAEIDHILDGIEPTSKAVDTFARLVSRSVDPPTLTETPLKESNSPAVDGRIRDREPGMCLAGAAGRSFRFRIEGEPMARSKEILWIVLIAQFMVVLDATVVTVALPSTSTSLRFDSQTQLHW